MKQITSILVVFTIITTTTLTAGTEMDRISKQIHSVCIGGNDMDAKIFMWGIASGVRYTQMLYSKGKDKFYVEDSTVAELACKQAIKDKTKGRFSAKFKNALVNIFSN